MTSYLPELYKKVPYNFANGPYRKEDIDLAEGINCQLFLHLLYKERFGIDLPKGLYSKELFLDNSLFRFVEQGERLMEGDVLFFGAKNLQDFRRLHLTYFTGDYTEQQLPNLLHCTVIEGGVRIWPFEKFSEYTRYEELYGIKRLQDNLHQTLVIPTLYI